MNYQHLSQKALLLVSVWLIANLFGCSKETSQGVAAGGSAAADKASEVPKIVKLAFVTNNPSQFWKIAEAGLKKYEKEGKVQVDLKMPDGTTEGQNKTLQNLANQGYHGIAVSVVAPDDQTRILNEVAKKTNLITHDSDAEKSDRLLYIGTNNFEAGKALGEQCIVKNLPEGGKIAVFVGTFAADNASQRLAGIEAAIKGKNIEIVDKREDNTDRAKARSNVEDIVNAHKDLNMVVGLWNYNGPAIVAALEGLSKQGKTLACTFDEDEETLEGIKKGVINATVVQKPFQFGYLSAKWLHELALKPEETKKKLPENRIIDTGVEVIDSARVDAFKKELSEMRGSGK